MRLLLLKLFMIVSLAAGLAADERIVRIGVLAFKSKEETLTEWTPTARYLDARIPGAHFVILPMNYPELRQAVTSEAIDFVITNSGHYVYLETTSHISRIATMMQYKGGQWLNRFGGVVFTRADRSDIRSLYDLEGKTIAAVDHDSLGGYALQLNELRKAGIEAGDVTFHLTGMPHARSVMEVLNGRADAGFVRTEVLESMARTGKVDLSAIKVLHPLDSAGFPFRLSTPLVPEWPIACLPKTPMDLTDKVVVALLEKGREQTPREGAIGWTAPLEYREVNELFKILRLPPYDKADRFTVSDIYERYRFFILTIAVLALLLVAGVVREIFSRRRLQRLLQRQIELSDRIEEESQKNALLIRLSGDGIHILDNDANIVQVSDRFCAMLGYPRDEMIGMNVAAWDAWLSPEGILREIRSCDEEPRTIQTKHRRKDGSIFDTEVVMSRITIGDQSYIYCSARDNTRLLAAHAQAQLAAMVYEHSSDAIVLTDRDATIISVNPAFVTLTGYTSDELKGHKSSIFRSGQHDTEFYSHMWRELLVSGRWDGEIIDRDKSGRMFSRWLTIRTVFDDKGEPYRRIAIFSEISDQKEAQRTIWYQANFDTLTGLANRHMFMDRLEHRLQAVEKSARAMALMVLDIDEFKIVNDTLGHDKGDQLLRMVSQRIVDALGNDNICGRLGGDEFGILVGHAQDHQALDMLATTLLSVLSQPYVLDGDTVYVSASIGVTVAPHDGNRSDILLKNADQAMYAAKNGGRNGYRYFTAGMQDAVNRRMRLISEMREAIDSRRFIVYYQPIVDAVDGRIRKAEALVRWTRDDGSVVSPADFIPLAEETGMILEIGEQVFRQAILQVKRWRALFDADFRISINKSPVQFRNDSQAVPSLIDLVGEYGIAPDAVIVEITEGVMMENSPIVRRKLQELQQRNFMIALDDFGTGYSSLSYLRKFDIDFLKIDQSFVRNLPANANDKVLCEAMVAMAHKLGIDVIAEGVETAAQHTYLAAIGCDYIQGFLISRPVPPEEFEKRFFDEHRR